MVQLGSGRIDGEVSLPEDQIIQIMLDEIDARNREIDRKMATAAWRQSPIE
jgi:hypothetical protein